ncbi:hypothetical protein [Occallatibacter savannae]|uniref:hypothetical protein n=1 Tax=Occallatibacter savannae TaxID=1002691 RepID=UPI000D69AD5F|nr:hypothetical protein [Occallatibacter savannae]
MFRKLAFAALLCLPALTVKAQAAINDEVGVRQFIDRWNAAYTGLNAKDLAALETADYEMIDRFGHWIKSEGPQFNENLWRVAFTEIYKGKPGPAREIESIRFLSRNIAIVQARANHADGVTLDDGSKIPPFWEINTYTLVKTDVGWRVLLLNIHNQIGPELEGQGQKVPTITNQPK